MKGFLLVGAFSALFAACGLHADGFGLRLSGGYGLSLNTTSDESNPYNPSTGVSTDTFTAVPASSGIPAGAELLYSCVPDIQLGLGVFPMFNSMKITSTVGEPGGITISGTDIYSADYYPILLSLYIHHPIGDGWGLFAGFGAGVVPAVATKQTFTMTVTGYSGTLPGAFIPNETLDAALALRGVLGIEYAANQHVRLGVEVQDMTFDQEEMIQGEGWNGQTYETNQIAPMVFLEGTL